jgi:hypothetical protein
MERNEEQKRMTSLLKGKTVKRILRPRQSEVVIDFTDGERFIIEIQKNELEFSITGVDDE